MPSKAYSLFRDSHIDVERLIQSHAQLNSGGKGKKGLGHITRGGVVMLCAAWEVYVEDLLVESVEFLRSNLKEPEQLPEGVQKNLSTLVRGDKNELRPIHFGGGGWKTVYHEYAQARANSLNTPKSQNIEKMMHEFVGLHSLADQWSVEPAAIDDFVSVRGAIAHRGRAAEYIRIQELKQYSKNICSVALDSDNAMAEYLKECVPSKKFPWYRVS